MVAALPLEDAERGDPALRDRIHGVVCIGFEAARMGIGLGGLGDGEEGAQRRQKKRRMTGQ